MIMTFTTLFSLTFTALLLASSAPAIPTDASASVNVFDKRRDATRSSKTGLAWPNGNWNSIQQFYATEKVSWYYSWSPAPIEDNTLEFTPMLWGQRQAEEFSSTIENTLATHNVKAILGMNEPNQRGQSDMSPQDGAAMWKQHIQPLKGKGLRLGSPAPTSAPNGKTWIQDFIAACDGCTVDFIALHYYDVNATQFINYITDFHNTFQLPIWVTEIACQNFNNGPQCTKEGTADFLKTATQFMDSTDWVERYSWFGAMEDLQGVNPDNALMDKEGKITDLGKYYIGASGDVPDGNGDGNGQDGSGSNQNGDTGGYPTIISSAASATIPVVLVTLFTLLSIMV